MEEEGGGVVVRAFDRERDCEGVEAVERMCEVGPSGEMTLFTDLLGDPVCRVRHSPAYLMLVPILASSSSSCVRVHFWVYFMYVRYDSFINICQR